MAEYKIEEMIRDNMKISGIDIIIIILFVALGFVGNGILGAIVGLFLYFLVYMTSYILFFPFGFTLFLLLAYYYLSVLSKYIFVETTSIPLRLFFVVIYTIVVFIGTVYGFEVTVLELSGKVSYHN